MDKSIGTFKEFHENTAGTAFGPAASFSLGAGAPSGDWYAPGDSRLPKVLGSKVQTRFGAINTKRRKKRKKKAKSKKK